MHLLGREETAAFSATPMEFESRIKCGSGISALEFLRSEDAR